MIINSPPPPDDSCCLNCGTALSGPYCNSCGQRQLDLDQPIRDLLREVVDSFLSLDARIIRTLWALISRPGWLTTEFLAGRRVRYVHPFKLYFAFSLLLFLALALTGYSSVRVGSKEDKVVAGLHIDTSSDEAEADSDPATEPKETSWLGRLFEPVGELAATDPDRLNRLFTDRLAKSIILLVPIFAALMRVLYRRSRYLAHLVFSLHLHSFAFLALLVGLALDLAPEASGGEGVGGGLSVLVIAGYSFLALRRVYGRGRFVTAFKMVLLLLGYLLALLVTMILTLVLTALTV